MKGQINKDGYLLIARRGKYVKQYCPFDSIATGGDYSSRDRIQCGDHCPLFGEFVGKSGGGDVEAFLDVDDDDYLDICNGKRLFFSKFEQVEVV